MVLITELEAEEAENPDPIFTISEDPAFMAFATTRTRPGEPLPHLLQQAYLDTSTHRTSENHRLALAALRKFGLVPIQTTAVDEASPCLGKFICSNLLDYHNIHPGKAQSPSIQFRINISQKDTSCTLNVPNRSKLVLLHLANRLHTNIYVFTNRSKPIAFFYPGSSSAIGFYSSIDSYRGTNKFYVLLPTLRDPSPRAIVIDTPGPGQPTPSLHPATLRSEQRKRICRRDLNRLPEKEAEQMFKKSW
jgi:hypothetical protein